MQRFYYLMCQSTWCQNASKFIYQKGEISFLWDTKTWSIASLIFMHAAELADDRNQVDLKIDPRLAWFFQNTRCSIFPPCSILPRLTIYIMYIGKGSRLVPLPMFFTHNWCITMTSWWTSGRHVNRQACMSLWYGRQYVPHSIKAMPRQLM